MAKNTKGAGQLVELVAFEERGLVANDYGAKQDGFVEQFRVRAAFEFARGGEDVIGARLEGKQPVLVRVRASAATRRIRPDWRMLDLHNSVAYAIRAIAPTPDRSGFLIQVESGVAA